MGSNIIYTIYQATNTQDGRVYIGATTKDVDQRRRDHEQKAKLGQGHEFHNAIATYGPEAFEWEQIDTASSINELSEKERAHIQNLKTNHNLYNGDCGGGFRKFVYQYSSIGVYLSTYDCLESAASAVSASIKDISAACLGKIRFCKGFYWSYTLSNVLHIPRDGRYKIVNQYTVNGQFLKQYDSVAQAAACLGIGKSSIAKVCRGLQKTAGGFTWQYQ